MVFVFPFVVRERVHEGLAPLSDCILSFLWEDEGYCQNDKESLILTIQFLEDLIDERIEGFIELNTHRILLEVLRIYIKDLGSHES